MMKRHLRNTKSVLVVAAAALMTIGTPGLSNATAQVKPAAGQATTKATSATAGTVVGWQGDGTGHYPDADPPTVWFQKKNGESKNILWKTKLPCYSWATPVIVGEKIFTRSEPYDLICLNKKDGKLLWIRSHPPIEGLTEKEKQANPAFKEVEDLVEQLKRVNDQLVSAGWSKELYTKKHDLQKQIDQKTAAFDKKYAMPPDAYVQKWTGYTAATPCSDGKYVYLYSGDGVTACYDLDGNKKWARYDQITKVGWTEHGIGTSPTLYKDMMIIASFTCFNSIIAVDKSTGKELWHSNVKTACGGGAATVTVFERNSNGYAIAAGNFVSLKDGKSYFGVNYADPAPAIDGDTAYFALSTGRLRACKFEAKANGDLAVTPVNGFGDPRNEYTLTIPIPDESKRWTDTNGDYYMASPIYYKGLLYVLSGKGNLVVTDVEKGVVLYQKMVPFAMRNPYRITSNSTVGMGIGASIVRAGKYLYMIDSGNCTMVIEPGREYKQIASNSIEETVSQWEPNYWTPDHQEQTEATPVFDGKRIYIRGEQFLYCIGEK